MWSLSLSRFKVKLQEYDCDFIKWVFFLNLFLLGINLWSMKITPSPKFPNKDDLVHSHLCSQNISVSDMVYLQTLTSAGSEGSSPGRMVLSLPPLTRRQVRPRVSAWSGVPQLTEAEPGLRRPLWYQDPSWSCTSGCLWSTRELLRRQTWSTASNAAPCASKSRHIHYSVPQVTKETFQPQKYKQTHDQL